MRRVGDRMIGSVGGMEFSGMTAGMAASGNAAYSAAQAKAQEARFADMLGELQRKAAAGGTDASREKPLRPEFALANAASLDPAAREKAHLKKRLKDACEGFEAMLLSIMYKEMRNTVPKNQLFGDDNAHDIWQSMLDSAMMEEAAKTGGIGLADVLYQQLEPQVLAEKAGSPSRPVTGQP